MPERAEIERTIRAYAAAWADTDREAWLATFASDATQEDPIDDPVRVEREQIGGFWDGAMTEYESLEILPREIFIVGREATMVWTINARTSRGTVTFHGVDAFTFDESAQIKSVRAYWERAPMWDQRERLEVERGCAKGML